MSPQQLEQKLRVVETTIECAIVLRNSKTNTVAIEIYNTIIKNLETERESLKCQLKEKL